MSIIVYEQEKGRLGLILAPVSRRAASHLFRLRWEIYFYFPAHRRV